MRRFMAESLDRPLTPVPYCALQVASRSYEPYGREYASRLPIWDRLLGGRSGLWRRSPPVSSLRAQRKHDSSAGRAPDCWENRRLQTVHDRGQGKIMAITHLQLVTPAIVNPTVLARPMPKRRPNAELRTREYLTEAEVGQLIEAAKANRYGRQAATSALGSLSRSDSMQRGRAMKQISALLGIALALSAAQAGAQVPRDMIRAAGTGPAATGKERLSDKASDNQRVNDCRVPPEKRGPIQRPTECAQK
jgi:hypothetical protein